LGRGCPRPLLNHIAKDAPRQIPSNLKTSPRMLSHALLSQRNHCH
jgi:hypothetical protein